MKKAKMAYKKPQLVAKNNPIGSFAAGCSANNRGTGIYCRTCEMNR